MKLFIALLLTIPALAMADLQPEDTAIVMGDQVRVRETPSTSAKIITELYTGHMLRVLGKSEKPFKLDPRNNYSFYWYEVEMVFGNGKRGWIYGQFLYVYNLHTTYYDSYKKLKHTKFKLNAGDYYFYLAENPIIYDEMPDDTYTLPGLYDDNLKLTMFVAKGDMVRKIPNHQYIKDTNYIFRLVNNTGIGETIADVETAELKGQPVLKVFVVYSTQTGGGKYTLWLKFEKNILRIFDVTDIEHHTSL